MMTIPEKYGIIMKENFFREEIFLNFTANCGIWGAMFGIPNVVADNFLKLATGEQLKVLLYILRNSGKSCSSEEIALNTGITAQEASDAVMFWSQVNVLSESGSSEVPLENIMTISPVSASPITAVPAEKQKASPRQKQHLTPTEITGMMKDSSDISELFKTAESCLGSLNNTQQNSLIWMYSYLGLKKEVIITLIAYCVSIEKTNAGYIEKIACSWSENEINTLDAAQNEVTRMKKSREFSSQIMREFEMNHRPTSKQEEYINQWKSIGFSIELIRYAYEKTIEQINKLSFAYINKILLSWRDSGFTNVTQVKNAESDYQMKKSSSFTQQNDFDVEKYKSLINKF